MSRHHLFDGIRIAIEMERRGIQLYARAQLFTEDPAQLSLLRTLEAEETGHMRQFMAILNDMDAPLLTPDEQEMAAALAAEHFFPGGLMQAALDGAFASPEAMLEEAMRAEKEAIAFYKRLGEGLSEKDRRILDMIIREEEGHLLTLVRHNDEIKEAQG